MTRYRAAAVAVPRSRLRTAAKASTPAIAAPAAAAAAAITVSTVGARDWSSQADRGLDTSGILVSGESVSRGR
jgi:hypothetical protein